MVMIIPWEMVPWKKLSAHSKGHWRPKSEATKQLREDSRKLLDCEPRARMENAVISLSFYMPDKRQRDTLNMAQSLKPAIDALVDEEIILDDNWRHLKVGAMHVDVDKHSPRVEIKVEPIIGLPPMARSN